MPAGASHAVVAAGERGAATAGREFILLAGPERGCASATQFVGLIPPGRAPDHFHRYDEVVYVLAGEGALHVGGERAPLVPGTAIHLPARLVHCLENSGPAEMRVLGVFRPAGSPAEAYYPDGSAAEVPAGCRTSSAPPASAGTETWPGAPAASTPRAAPSPACPSRFPPGSASRGARRARKSCWQRRTAAASRCPWRAS